MSHGLWPAPDPVSGRRGAHAPPDPYLSARRPWPAAGLRCNRQVQEDPDWRDYLSFYEYFHGDNGAGLGASHQTGWTGVIARGMHLFATSTAEELLELGKAAAFTELEEEAQRS